ncbi:MAG: rRNA pseudouridine synthase [Azoarcus sp.]|jgi:23S rRNA pseudouridine2604 synthase|nr:rRNA pseudouridine synthase [Azoarcus sp.]
MNKAGARPRTASALRPPRVPRQPFAPSDAFLAGGISREKEKKHAAGSASSAAEGVRLSKLMAERGLCSRREADELIERGWVFVDGERVSTLGVRVPPLARIALSPKARQFQGERITVLLHKPIGYVSGQPEPGYRPAVSLIRADTQFGSPGARRFRPAMSKGLAPAGRLDIDSTGLLVLTQDGRIARQLIGGDGAVEKEYLVRVEGHLAENGLALLNHGLELDGHKLRPARVEWINGDQLRFVLREGRKRQIRRMCELTGLRVLGLKRVRIGKVRLGDLPLGQWRFLGENEGFA